MKHLFITLGIVAVIVGGVFWFYSTPEPTQSVLGTGNQGKVATSTGNRLTIVGARTGNHGTTTTGVNLFHYTDGTTTYPFRIGSHVDSTTFFFKSIGASTTAQGAGAVYFSLLASNDYGCETATTTGYFDLPLIDEIDWYDVGLNTLNYANTVTLPLATTTFNYAANDADINRTVTLTNLNANCLALEIKGTSTVLFVEAISKSFGQGY